MKLLSLLGLCACFCLVPPLLAQPPSFPLARLYSIYPMGGQKGTTVRVNIQGVDLEEANELLFTDRTITAKRVADPAKPGQFLLNQFDVTIPGGVSPQFVDVQAIGAWGVTNPRTFVIGNLPEQVEKEPNNDIAQAQKMEAGSIVNGVINAANDVDYFSFDAKKGQHLVLRCNSTSIDSKLDADIRVYNKAGKQLAANRPRSGPDATCDFTCQADDLYHIRLCSHAHIEGDANCFYRLSIGTLPHINFIYPPLVVPGQVSSVTVYGKNLPDSSPAEPHEVGKLQLEKTSIYINPPRLTDAPSRWLSADWIPSLRAGLDGMTYRMNQGNGSSNEYPIGYAAGPMILDNSHNDTAKDAQPASIPCELVGRIEKQNDVDWYTFTGKKGQQLVLEAFAERIGTPIDIVMTLHRHDNGSIVSEYDESDQPSFNRFFARTDDPIGRITLPVDGQYDLKVTSRDASVRGDPTLIYRVTLRAPKPDFRVVVVPYQPQSPSALVLYPGERRRLDVIIFRQDGYNEPITINAEGPLAGFVCLPQTIPAGVNIASIIIGASPEASDWTGRIQLVATGGGSNPQVREVRTGTMLWPNPAEPGAPGASRVCRETLVAIRSKVKSPVQFPATFDPISIPFGGGAAVKFKLERTQADLKTPVQIVIINPPPGVIFNNNNQPITVAGDKSEGEFRLACNSVATLSEFPLILQASTQVPFAKDPAAKQKPNVQFVTHANPIKVNIYKQVAEVTANPVKASVKQGAEVVVTLTVKRLHNFSGAYQVQFANLPKGVTLANTTIAEKTNEIKLTIKAAKDAAEVTEAKIGIKLIAQVGGATLTTDATLPLSVIK